MQPQADHASTRRATPWATALLRGLLCWMFLLPSMAWAVGLPSTYPGCANRTATVAWGGTVNVDLSTCHFFGLGVVSTAPTHGTATIGDTPPVDSYNYNHNGSSPAGGGTDTFVVLDDNSDFITVTVTIQAPTSAISVSPASLPAMSAGTPFSQTLTSSGGLAPYTYTLQSGTLPLGLTLSSSGVISGTPTQRGSYGFTVRSTDATTPTAQFTNKGYSGTVDPAPLSITPASATAIQSAPFSQTLTVNGGVAPHTCLDESGGFPAGITISSACVISGTTTAAPGSYPVTIRVTDASTGVGSHFELESFTITVSPPPSVSIAVTPASVSEDGATNLTYTVTRSLNISSPTTVNLAIGGTATNGTDYAAIANTVTIPSGATTATITVDPTVDGTVEVDESVILTVIAGTGYTVGAPNIATGTILNDDVPTATITVSPANVAEDGAPNLVFTVTLNQANPSAATTVNYTIGGTATNGTDYATITSPLVIPAGVTTGTITVNPTADATIETNETVTLTLNAGAGYTVGVPNAATGTILNDDLPNLAINNVTANEGNAGTTNFTFTVSLSAPAGPGGVTFDIANADGTATASGSDYQNQVLTGQTIPTGSSTYTFTVLVNGDLLNEPSETFFVNVTNVVNAVVVDGQGVGTINNDDPLPSLSINDVTVVEGNTGAVNAVFTVTLNAASGQTVTVNYATADATATQPADYTNTSGSLTFTPGQTTRTITVPVISETVPEANETFFVNLSGATNATISDNQGVGTITNDDVPVTVAPGSLPNGQVGLSYSQTITASGGTGPYSFAVTAGALPAGVTLSTGGSLSGTPTAGGSFNFTITATDSSPFPGPFSGSQPYTLSILDGEVVLPPDTLPDGTIGVAYTGNTGPASGATAPYSYAVTAGALPGGLSINASSGQITGLPNAAGTFNFSVTATDSSTGTGPYDITENYSVTIIDIPPVANNSSLTVAYNAPATNVPLNITGGAATSLAIVTPPSNGSVIVSGTTITYQPTTGYAGPDSFSYTATNSGGTSAAATVSVTVQDPIITITPSGGFAATVAAPYTQTFTFNGGAQPWSTYQVTNLPVGLSITSTTANTVTISGTPTQAGTFNLNVSATDSSTGNGPYTIGQAFGLTVAAPTLTMTPAPGTLNAPYATAFSQSFTASGGIGPYTYALTGVLPTGLTFSGNSITGTPTVPGSYPITVTATDTGSTGTGSPFSIAQNYTVDVPAPVIVVSPATLPNPTAATAYSQTLTASGGAGPYSFAVSAGSLPPGITLASGGALSGTSNQVGSYNFTVTATDNFGQTGSRAYTVTIAAPTLTMTPAPGTLNAPYATAFSQTFTASGGSNSFSYALTGTLPTGLTFSGNTISGTPTVPGSYPITVTATDTVLTGVGAPFSVAQNYTIDVPAPTIVVNPASLPNPTAASAYSQTITASGGAAPYSFAVSAGSLPPGITLASGGALSGTSNQVGSYNFTVTATDNFGQTGSRAYTVTIAAPTLTMTPAPGTLNAPYATPFTQAFPASGGSGSFSYALTGTLPTGLNFSGNTISGTPTVPGSYPITVTATDTVLTGVGAPFSIAQNYTIDVPAPVIVVNPASLPGATAASAYSQTITASGGAAPYSFAVTAGSLPAGLTLSAAGVLSGSATASGTFNFTVTATDNFGQTGTRAYTLAVAAPTLTMTPAAGALPGGTAGVAYSQTFVASGGNGPYSYAISAGALPAGLTLSSAGALSGTPTVAGTFNFSVTATDSTTGTAGTVTQAYSLTLVAPTITVNPATLPVIVESVPFSQALSATGGTAPYSFAVTAGALPAGITLSSAGVLSGTASVSGAFSFTVTATDALGFPGSRAYTVTVAPRPDPTQDPDVRGLLDAQVDTSRRLVEAQLGNFGRRLETLRAQRQAGGNGSGGSGEGGSALNSAVGLSGVASSLAADPIEGTGTGNAVSAPSPLGFWASGSWRRGERDANGGTSASDFESDGLSAGMDYRFSSDFVLGAGLGYGRDEVDVGNDGSRSDADAQTFALYASHRMGDRGYVDWIVGYQRLGFDLRRYVALSGNTVTGSRDGSQAFASLAFGVDIEQGDWQFNPYLRYDHAAGSLDRYTETGDALYALTYAEQDVDYSALSLGARLRRAFALQNGSFTPQLRFEYQDTLSGDSVATLWYADQPSRTFTWTSVGQERERWQIGLGFEWITGSGWSWQAEYTTRQDGDQDSDSGIQLQFGKDF